jgi:hypothetical protein
LLGWHGHLLAQLVDGVSTSHDQGGLEHGNADQYTEHHTDADAFDQWERLLRPWREPELR